MPSDKHYVSPHTFQRPLMPTLSASNKPWKPPLTPRVATTATPSPASAPSASPVLRRAQTAGGDPAPSKGPKADLSTPVKAFLSSNVTPRSASRKTRADSASSTPTGTPKGTPTSSKPASAVGPATSRCDGPAAEATANAAQATSGSPRGLTNTGRGESPLQVSPLAFARGQRPRTFLDGPPIGAGPTFFYADEANRSPTSPRHTLIKPVLPAKTSSFIYANGDQGDAPLEEQVLHNIHGNTTLPEHLTEPHLELQESFPFPIAPVVSANALTRPTTSDSKTGKGRLPQAASPDKHTRPSAPSSFPTSFPSSSSQSSHSLSPLGIPADVAETRGELHKGGLSGGPISSPQSPVQYVAHSKSISMSALDSMSPSKRRSGVGTAGFPSTTRDRHFKVDSDTALECNEPKSIDQGVEQVLSPRQITDNGTSTLGEYQQLDDLAAKARRERKVLDLEISNSSLMAINKSLERQLRKQHAELRRFRRLSRTGRLSLFSEPARSSLTRISLPAEGVVDLDGSDGSEEDEGLSLSTDESDGEDGSRSPNTLAESDARHRAHDEQRLRLDLAKHQELLVSSQRMNQSLKRCLAWTEELIGEGRRALDYHVRVADVKLGGRVLPPEEEDEIAPDA
ncbi:MAG: hypothetical protein M1833_005664 [Piccolia ochrophora]|nr:MAG: hypothetical protein M1833_005664 [Piccolia ochrophora]